MTGSRGAIARCLPFLTMAMLGCTTATGRFALATSRPGIVGLKLLRPGVERRACTSTVLGFGPVAPSAEALVATLLEEDPEGEVLTDLEVRSETIVTGVYNRRCVVVRGDLARTTSSIAMPAPAGGHGAHHGH
jgi:hypothetical protein